MLKLRNQTLFLKLFQISDSLQDKFENNLEEVVSRSSSHKYDAPSRHLLLDLLNIIQALYCNTMSSYYNTKSKIES